MPEILSILHPDSGHSGIFHPAAAREGVTIEEWMPAEQDRPLRDPFRDYDGLLVLGGDENVGEEDRYPYLSLENEIVAHWLEEQRPVMGICLGAQMIANLAGGSVRRLEENEFGWLEIRNTEAAATDPLLEFAPAGIAGMLWHDFAVDAPPEATVLATSDACTQAFRLGEAWAFQSHPEVNEAILLDWLRPDAKDQAIEGRAEAKRLMAEEMPAYLPAWSEYGTELFRRFARRCR